MLEEQYLSIGNTNKINSIINIRDREITLLMKCMSLRGYDILFIEDHEEITCYLYNINLLHDISPTEHRRNVTTQPGCPIAVTLGDAHHVARCAPNLIIIVLTPVHKVVIQLYS